MSQPLMIVIRTILALISLMISTKVLTKRSLSKLTHFDYLALTTMGTLAGNLAFNIKIKITYFIISITTVILVIYFASYISLKSSTLRKYLAGEPTTLIKDGKILENNMSKLKYSYDYLMGQLRREQIFDIGNVQTAILEANGELSIQLKSQNRPLTPKDMNILTGYEGTATEIIVDGKMIENNIMISNITIDWLNNQLKLRGIRDIKEVSFAALSSNGNLYVDLYNDNLS